MNLSVHPPRTRWHIALASVALLMLVVVGCTREPEPAVPAGPAETVRGWYQAMHEDDVGTLFERMLPPARLAAMRQGWERRRAEPPEIAENDRRQFAQMMADLTADGAEDRLYRQIEPTLVRMESELAAQLPLMIAMGTGFASAGIQENDRLSEAQKKHASEVIGALAGWLATAPLADRDRARNAIGEISNGARALELDTLDEVYRLEFDQVLARLGIVSATAKAVLALYGLDLGASLSGATFTVLEQDPAHATVRIDYPLAASRLHFDLALVRVDDRWYSQELIEALAEHDAGPAAAAAPGAVTPGTTPPDTR